MKRQSVLIETSSPPVVELDSEAHAAYVRFSRERVVETRPLHIDDCIITMDVDAKGRPIGIELIGVHEFGIAQLLEIAGLKLREGLSERVRYVPANVQPA